MNIGKAALWIIERLFDVAELVSAASDRSAAKRKQLGPSPLTLKELMEIKRQDEDLYRRTNAPTVLIPPPSEREKRR